MIQPRQPDLFSISTYYRKRVFPAEAMGVAFNTTFTEPHGPDGSVSVPQPKDIEEISEYYLAALWPQCNYDYEDATHMELISYSELPLSDIFNAVLRASGLTFLTPPQRDAILQSYIQPSLHIIKSYGARPGFFAEEMPKQIGYYQKRKIPYSKIYTMELSDLAGLLKKHHKEMHITSDKIRNKVHLEKLEIIKMWRNPRVYK